jgi:hypothetical protein
MKNESIKKWYLFSFVFLLSPLFVACSGGGSKDNSDESDESNSSSSYSVKINSLSAKKNTTTGVTIYVTLSTTGVKANQVEMLGAQGGSTTSASGGLWGAVGAGETSGTAVITTANSNKTYYIKGFLKTSSGTVYSDVKKITTR